MKKYFFILQGEDEIASYPCRPISWHLVVVHCWKYFVSIFPEANALLCSRTNSGLFLSYFVQRLFLAQSWCQYNERGKQLPRSTEASQAIFASRTIILPLHENFLPASPRRAQNFFLGVNRYKTSQWQSSQSKRAEWSSCFYSSARLQNTISPLL